MHVSSLVEHLAKKCDIEIRCFGDQSITKGNPIVRGFVSSHAELNHAITGTLLNALNTCINMSSVDTDADVLHVHTWYTYLAGILMKMRHELPLIVTSHSLEPMRPWKRESLGNDYDVSLWLEESIMAVADAIIAVSEDMRDEIRRIYGLGSDVVHVIPNGVDVEFYRPVMRPDVLLRYGIDPDVPYVLFVGRIARQKGILDLLRAVEYLDPGCQVVLYAKGFESLQIEREMRDALVAAQTDAASVLWVEELDSTSDKVALLSHASVLCCPSVYEPFGIVNLEAMACETPVVASAVGGITEVVVDQVTGIHVALELDDHGWAANPDRYAKDLASAINRLVGSESLRRRMARAGRQRVAEHFSWDTVAERTHTLYRTLAG